MTTRVTLQPSFVLHTKPFRDTSLLVDLMTLEYGRVHTVARSARGHRSRFRGILRPFVPLMVSWVGKGELVALSHAETTALPYALQGQCLLSGFYVNELLVRLLHRNDPYPNLFTDYQQVLQRLQDANQQESALRLFEKHLLARIGYGLVLHKQADTGTAITAEQFYRYEVNRGFIQHTGLVSSIVFRGKSLLAFHAEQLHDSQVLQDAKKLIRLVLGALLGGKPLKSRELFSANSKSGDQKLRR